MLLLRRASISTELVVEKYGEDEDRDFRYGSEQVQITDQKLVGRRQLLEWVRTTHRFMLDSSIRRRLHGAKSPSIT
jgi:hypothetical protein